MSSRMKQKKARREKQKETRFPTPKGKKKFPGLQMQWRPLSKRKPKK